MLGLRHLIGVLLAGSAGLTPARTGGACVTGWFCRCVSASDRGLTERELILEQRDRADVVMLARVTRIDTIVGRLNAMKVGDVARLVVARLTVERSWRGAPVDTATVGFTLLDDPTSCDFELRAGERHLLFARRVGPNLLWTGQCTGSIPAVDADSAIAALGAAEERGGRVR